MGNQQIGLPISASPFGERTSFWCSCWVEVRFPHASVTGDDQRSNPSACATPMLRNTQGRPLKQGISVDVLGVSVIYDLKTFGGVEARKPREKSPPPPSSVRNPRILQEVRPNPGVWCLGVVGKVPVGCPAGLIDFR